MDLRSARRSGHRSDAGFPPKSRIVADPEADDRGVSETTVQPSSDIWSSSAGADGAFRQDPASCIETLDPSALKKNSRSYSMLSPERRAVPDSVHGAASRRSALGVAT